MPIMVISQLFGDLLGSRFFFRLGYRLSLFNWVSFMNGPVRELELD